MADDELLDLTRQEMIECVASLQAQELNDLKQSLRLLKLRRENEEMDLSMLLGGDAIATIGSFLGARDMSILQNCNKHIRESLDSEWKAIGCSKFANIRVNDERFDHPDEMMWYSRYSCFTRALRIFPTRGVLSSDLGRGCASCIPLFRKVSCTIPAMFSVVTSGKTFIEMTVSVRFSPEAVRSVIGIIESPLIGGLDSLMCDRALSRKHWGLAFGPLTGVVSTGGKYFDDFTTYRARHGLHDYLSRAMEQTVTVKVGIFIDERRIAFYRLPETDYPDWESTGFVYKTDHKEVLPCIMFSHIGHRDSISISIDRISERPPYFPHMNDRALADNTSWNSFAESNLDDVLAPPPNSPMMMSRMDLVDVGEL